MIKFCSNSELSISILVIFLSSTIIVDGKLTNLLNSLDESSNEIRENAKLLHQRNEMITGHNTVQRPLKSNPKAVPLDIVSKIERNLKDLVNEGFRRAEDILRLENEAVQSVKRNKTVSGNKINRRNIFHSKRTSITDKAASACVGLGMLETSKLIVKSFDVPKDEVAKILGSLRVPVPEIEAKTRACLSRSKRPFMDHACDENYPFRRLDALCNNLIRKYDGAAGSQLKRYLEPVYEDGVNLMVGDNRVPPQALPNARDLSNALNGVPVIPTSNTYTQMVKGFGQFLDHDLTSTTETTAQNGDLPCCEDGVDDSETSDCRPIKISDSDPFYMNHGIKCLRFVRSLVADVGFSFSPREQINSVTAFVDASNVYGSNFEEALSLRERTGGKMKENARGEDGSCSSACELPFLPETADATDFFIAGDKRVNEQPGLTTFHTIFVRYHNVLAEELAISFPLASDEDIYQTVRRFVIAAMQHIVYNEFLPIVLSPQFAQAYGLLSFQSGYLSANDYRECFNPSIANVFATAAYRFGHSLVGPTIKGGSETIPLSHCFFNNKFIRDNANMFPSRIIEGEMDQASMSMDVSLVDDIRNKLFAEANEESGLDLLALNIMRGRDHGLPSYNDWREFFDLPRFANFNALKASGLMSSDAVDVFDSMYPSIDDLEIFVAGIAEKPVAGAVVGETFLAIIAQQFQDLKYGDRFWYEGLAQPHPFSAAQLAAIRRTTLASVICEATDLTSVPANPFLLSSNGANPPVSCALLTAGTISDGITTLLSS